MPNKLLTSNAHLTQIESRLLDDIKKFYLENQDIIYRQKKITAILMNLVNSSSSSLSSNFIASIATSFYETIQRRTFVKGTLKNILWFFFALGKLAKQKKLLSIESNTAGIFKNLLMLFFEKNTGYISDIALILNSYSSLLRDNETLQKQIIVLPNNILSINEAVTSKDIGMILHAIGIFSKCGILAKKSLSFCDTNNLLMHLQSQKDIASQDMASSLYGISLSAEAGILNSGKFNKSITKNLTYLFLRKINPADKNYFANFFYGLSILSKENRLCNDIQINLVKIKNALIKLNDIDGTSIAICLHSLGILSKNNTLKYTISSNLINSCLKIACEQQASAQDISMILLGTANLAEKNVIENDYISENLIVDLVKILLKDILNAEPKQLSNILYALSILAKSKYLNRSIKEKETVFDLMCDVFYCTLTCFQTLDAQAVSISLYGLGVFSYQMNVQESKKSQFTQHVIQTIFDFLERGDFSPQHTANALYGLGFLSPHFETNQLFKIKGLCLGKILRNLLTNEIKSDELTMSFYGLKRFSETGFLEKNSLSSELISEIFNHVFEISQNTEVNEHILSSIVYNLGFIACSSHSFRLNQPLILNNNFLSILQKCHSSNCISASIYGLGLIAKYATPIAPSEKTTNTLVNLLERLGNKDSNNSTIINSLRGLSFLALYTSLNIPCITPDRLGRILNSISFKDPFDCANCLYLLGLLSRMNKISVNNDSLIESLWTS